MRLADFILADIERILAEWEIFARSIWPGAATDPATLRDHAGDILRATAGDMKSDQTEIQQSDKSKGKGGSGEESVRINRASATHGADRMTSGFDLAAVISEYRALRASVIRLWRESNPTPDPNDVDDLTRFNESMDQSLTEAVLAYTQVVEQERQKALDERERRARELRGLNEQLLVSSVRQHELTEEAQKAGEMLREANRAKDTFLAVLSHELRTPLTPVVLTVCALEMDPALPFKFRDELAMMRQNIDLEVKLIDDLLDISRVISGKLRLQRQPVRVHELLTHVLRNSVSDTSSKRLCIRQELDADNDRLLADPARLQQVFWNLVRNSVKFTPEGGEITVRTWNAKDNGQLHIEVRDTGMGIEPDVLPRIFDAFEQGKVRTTGQSGGLGLGLAIAKAVVEMHGGKITASSEGAHRGAVFKVALKTDPAPAPGTAHAPVSDAVRQPSRFHLRVLLVEDHPDTARVLGRLLRSSEYKVAIAHNAAAALQLAAAEPFDIVISDIGLPDATGYELMRQIRDRHHIKGIALSGYGMEEDMRKGREAGFADHVVKPVNFTQLQAIIQRVMGQT